MEPSNERFWAKVAIIPFHTCWEWTGAKGARGYGNMSFNKKFYTAHRFSWEIHNGKIPNTDAYHGNVVMHLCDNKLCVNPAHLSLGSQSDNIKDCYAKGRSSFNKINRINSQKITCNNGHELIAMRNYRYCRICSKIRMRRRRSEQRSLRV